MSIPEVKFKIKVEMDSTEAVTKAVSETTKELGNVETAAKDASTAVDKLDTAFNKAGKWTDKFNGLSDEIKDIGKAGKVFEGLFSNAKDLTKDFSKSTDKFVAQMKVIEQARKKQKTDKKKQELDRITPPAEELESEAPILLASNSIKGLGIGQQGTAAQAQPGASQRLFEGKAEQRSKDKKDEKEHQGSILDLDRETWDSRLSIAGSSAGQMSNILQNLHVMAGGKSKAMFNVMKAFAMAEAVIQGIRAVIASYAVGASIGGPIVGAAFAAVAVAATASRLKQIASTKPGAAKSSIAAGGSANPTYKGGSEKSQPVPQKFEQGSEPKQTQSITIQVFNPLSEQNWSEIAENNIIPAINDATENRNIELIVKPAVA